MLCCESGTRCSTSFRFAPCLTPISQAFQPTIVSLGISASSIAERTNSTRYSGTAHYFLASCSCGGLRCPARETGRAFDNRYCWVVRFAGGKIVEVRAYLDSALVQRLFDENPI